jgi:hypothetical protein
MKNNSSLMKNIIFTFALLLSTYVVWADDVFKVNGEIIEKTPATITWDFNQPGYVNVEFTDGSVLNYNMNLLEYYPNGEGSIDTSVDNIKSNGIFFSINGKVEDVLRLEGLTPGRQLSIYTANGMQVYNGNTPGETMSIDVTHLKSGVYLLRVGRQAVKFIKK